MIFEIVTCGIAAALFGRGLYHSGWITQGSTQPEWRHCAEADGCVSPRTVADERRDALMFKANPLAFWLDPNRYGTDPDWEARLFPAPKPAPLVALHNPQRAKTPCEHRFAWKPEIWPWKDRYTCIDCDEEMLLPCGCPGTTQITRGPSYSMCKRCKAEWEPASNDPTGRRLGQGERVLPAITPQKKPSACRDNVTRD